MIQSLQIMFRSQLERDSHLLTASHTNSDPQPTSHQSETFEKYERIRSEIQNLQKRRDYLTNNQILKKQTSTHTSENNKKNKKNKKSKAHNRNPLEINDQAPNHSHVCTESYSCKNLEHGDYIPSSGHNVLRKKKQNEERGDRTVTEERCVEPQIVDTREEHLTRILKENTIVNVDATLPPFAPRPQFTTKFPILEPRCDPFSKSC